MTSDRFPDQIRVVRDRHVYVISPAQLQIGDVVEMPDDSPYRWGRILGQRVDGRWDITPTIQPYCSEMDYGNSYLNFGVHTFAKLTRFLEP